MLNRQIYLGFSFFFRTFAAIYSVNYEKDTPMRSCSAALVILPKANACRLGFNGSYFG